MRESNTASVFFLAVAGAKGSRRLSPFPGETDTNSGPGLLIGLLIHKGDLLSATCMQRKTDPVWLSGLIMVKCL